METLTHLAIIVGLVLKIVLVVAALLLAVRGMWLPAIFLWLVQRDIRATWKG